MAIYYKVLVKGMKHKDFQYKIGENILDEKFNPDGDCCAGGFYICGFKDVCYWLELYENMATICEVILFEDSQLVRQGRKYKTDKLILQNPLPISEFLKKHNLCEDAIECNPRDIPTQAKDATVFNQTKSRAKVFFSPKGMIIQSWFDKGPFTIAVYSINGKKISVLKRRNTTVSGVQHIYVNRFDSRISLVPGGIYVFHIQSARDKKAIKVPVIW